MSELEQRAWEAYEKKFDAALTQKGMMGMREAMKDAFQHGFKSGWGQGFAAATRRETPKDECTSTNS